MIMNVAQGKRTPEISEIDDSFLQRINICFQQFFRLSFEFGRFPYAFL